jgi:hypothetical protein
LGWLPVPKNTSNLTYIYKKIKFCAIIHCLVKKILYFVLLALLVSNCYESECFVTVPRKKVSDQNCLQNLKLSLSLVGLQMTDERPLLDPILAAHLAGQVSRTAKIFSEHGCAGPLVQPVKKPQASASKLHMNQAGFFFREELLAHGTLEQFFSLASGSGRQQILPDSQQCSSRQFSTFLCRIL